MILLLPVFDFSNIVICQWFGEKKKKKKKKKKGKKEKKRLQIVLPMHENKKMRIETTLAFDHRYKHITLIR